MAAMLRVGMAGCGWVAGSQMERGFDLLRDRFVVLACCDTDYAKATSFAARYGIGAALPDYDTLLTHANIDVVSICTPPSLHYEMVIKALSAGKHVICEKPFTRSLRLM